MSREVYPDMEEFYHDLGLAYRAAVQAFADAGCRYLQLDETNLAYLCDTEQVQNLADRGEDTARLPGIYTRMLNTAIEDRPTDMAITIHLCRGNFRSSWIAQGGYEPIAELLFNDIAVNGYFMEFDSERAGGFEPLRFVPKGKIVVLGLVTSKSGQLESKDEMKRSIHQAAKYVDLDQLCLSPQCGFASTEEGNRSVRRRAMGQAGAHRGGCAGSVELVIHGGAYAGFGIATVTATSIVIGSAPKPRQLPCRCGRPAPASVERPVTRYRTSDS